MQALVASQDINVGCGPLAAGDLAVQEAVKIGLGLKTRPTAKEMAPLAEPWRPLRGAAAHLWWSYYRVLKKREGVIADLRKTISNR